MRQVYSATSSSGRRNGSSWVSDGTVSGQLDDWSYEFTSPVTTTQIRIYGAHADSVGTQNSNPMIFEWDVYLCE